MSALPGIATAIGRTNGAPAMMSLRPSGMHTTAGASNGELHAVGLSDPTSDPSGSQLMSFQGGSAGVGVVTGVPKVYVVFWGSQWGAPATTRLAGREYTAYQGDPSGLAPILQAFYAGLGTNTELWSGVLTTYCQSSLTATVHTGATSCPVGATHVAYPGGGALAGVWEDTRGSAPQEATQSQLAAEAQTAAAHFGAVGGPGSGVQFVIVSPHGANPDGFDTSVGDFCAWHDVAWAPGATPVAYTNLPYVPDAGYACGANYVNGGPSGSLDGVTVIASHEYAETLTDPYVGSGWYNRSGGESADVCAWVPLDQNGGGTITTATGTFPVTGVWDNLARNGAGGCELSHRLIASHTIVVVSPGSRSTVAAMPVDPIAVVTSDAGAPTGDPVNTAALPTLHFSATGLPRGLSIDPSTGLITGSPRGSGGIAHVTITVTDSTGGVGTTRFTLVVRDPITFTRIHPMRTAAGVPVRLRVRARDLRGGRIRYTAAGLPHGLSINSRTGLISGRIHRRRGAVRVTVIAHGSGGVRARASFRWTVR
jgi:hypothetical protein